MNTGSDVKTAIDYRQEFLKAKGIMFMRQNDQDYGYVVYNGRVVGESKEAAYRYIDFIDEMERLYDINAKEVTQFMINYFFTPRPEEANEKASISRY